MSDLQQQLEEKTCVEFLGSSSSNVPVDQMSYVSAMIYFSA